MVAIAIAQKKIAATIKQHKMECGQPCEGFQVPLNVGVAVFFLPCVRFSYSGEPLMKLVLEVDSNCVEDTNSKDNEQDVKWPVVDFKVPWRTQISRATMRQLKSGKGDV
jgi:hypothetical protein